MHEPAFWHRPSSLTSRLLTPIAALYGAIAARRMQRPGADAGIPVICVGNYHVGGAGKTPTVIALAEWLRREGWRPGVVSRGYGRIDGDAIVDLGADTPAAAAGDEPLLIHRRTGVPVVVGRDRIAAARALLDHHREVDILLSDDGLQHHRLPRDVEIVVFDDRGAGNGLMLPAGPLRQPLPAHLPAQMQVLYNATRPSTRLPGTVARRALAGAMPLDAWWQGRREAVQPLDALQGRLLLAAAGMGDPERFFGMLEAAGLTIQRLPLPDHASFAPLPWPADTSEVLVTEKDAVKLPPERVGATRVWVVALDFALPPEFTAALRQRLPDPADRATPSLPR